MHKSRWLVLAILIVTGIFFSFGPAFGDDDNTPPSFDAAHKLLQQAADAYKADTPPVAADQVKLLEKAVKILGQIPRGGYHGQLKAAIKSIESAIDEINTGDTAHRAKEDIYDADDAVRSIMSS